MKHLKRSLVATFLVAVFLVWSLIQPISRGESPIDLGLDLSGGVIVTYRPDFSSRLSSATASRLPPSGETVSETELLALAKETLTSRLYRSLDTVPDVVVRGDQRIVVSLPSSVTPGEDRVNQRILELVGRTYQLTFRLVLDGEPAAGEETYDYLGRRLHLAAAEFSGDMLDPRFIRVETGGLDPHELPQATVTFRFQPPYDQTFARLTGDNVGRELAILIDGEVEWAGRIESAIDGEGVLRGGYRIDEATEIARMLRSGTLPVSLEVESLTAVGPGLGQEIQDLGVEALGLSLALLLALLAAAYLHRGSLLIAGVASLFCLLFLIAGIVAAFSLTLDLVGIAGLVLSLGMGMDAFLLIFEALKAQPDTLEAPRRRGWTIRRLYSFAREGGTLFHANATTLVVISLLLATERLKSFAVFIFVGILASVLTIFVTRRVLRWTHGRVGGVGPDLLAWLRGRKPGVFRWRRAYFALSAAILVAGLLAPSAGLELGSDFTEGTQVIVSASRETQVAAAVDELGRRYPEVDLRRQVLGDPEDDRYLLTLSAALELERPRSHASGAASGPAPPLRSPSRYARTPPGPNIAEHQAAFTRNNLLGDSVSGKLRSQELLAIFAGQAVEVESVSSIDGRLSSRRLLGSLTVLAGSFGLLLVYFLGIQGPIDRALSTRKDRLPAVARLRIWSGVLSAVRLDVAVVLAVMAVRGIPITLPVGAGLLTVLGYSVNDSVVLWDHIRRRWAEGSCRRSPAEVVTAAVDGILSRALLTSLSTLVPALVILAVGLTPLVDFAWVILAGVVSGTLSSMFVVGSFAVRALGACRGRASGGRQPAVVDIVSHQIQS